MRTRQHRGEEVVLGVDTHLDVARGGGPGRPGQAPGRACGTDDQKGYECLVAWAEGFGPVRCAGVEGTSSYGAGLARHLKAAGIRGVRGREAQASAPPAQGEVRLP